MLSYFLCYEKILSIYHHQIFRWNKMNLLCLWFKELFKFSNYINVKLWYSDQIDILTIVCFTDKQRFIYIYLKEKPRFTHLPIEIIFISIACYFLLLLWLTLFNSVLLWLLLYTGIQHVLTFNIRIKLFQRIYVTY